MWTLTSATDTSHMFRNTPHFDQELNTWDVSGIQRMEGMFWESAAFNKPLNNWDVSNVLTLNHMFESSVFNQDISSWDLSSAANMARMFSSAAVFNQDLCSWGPQLQGKNILGDAFTNSGCPEGGTASDASADPVTPLCHTCPVVQDDVGMSGDPHVKVCSGFKK